MSMFCGRRNDLAKIEARLCCRNKGRHESSRELLVSPRVSDCIEYFVIDVISGSL